MAGGPPAPLAASRLPMLAVLAGWAAPHKECVYVKDLRCFCRRACSCFPDPGLSSPPASCSHGPWPPASLLHWVMCPLPSRSSCLIPPASRVLAPLPCLFGCCLLLPWLFACLSGRFYQLLCRGRLCRCILGSALAGGVCFCFPFPFLLLYPGRRLCCVRLKVLLLYRSATLASLLRVAPRLPKHARVLGGGSQAPAALPPLFSPDWPACALLCRFHPPLPPQVSLNRLEGSAPAR